MNNLCENNLCECWNWASNDVAMFFITGHHENCPKRIDDVQALKNLIKELKDGIEIWSMDCDGVHKACWEPYRKAAFLIGGLHAKWRLS